jgi:hypothetical protein
MKKTDELGCAGWIVIIIGLCAVIMLLMWPTMLLWNALIPVLFGGPTLTYWQTFGLWVLCGALFRSSQVSNNLFKE